MNERLQEMLLEPGRITVLRAAEGEITYKMCHHSDIVTVRKDGTFSCTCGTERCEHVEAGFYLAPWTYA